MYFAELSSTEITGIIYVIEHIYCIQPIYDFDRNIIINNDIMYGQSLQFLDIFKS